MCCQKLCNLDKIVGITYDRTQNNNFPRGKLSTFQLVEN